MFTPKHVAAVVHTAVCSILDTGCRIDEVLLARVRDFDLDNCC